MTSQQELPENYINYEIAYTEYTWSSSLGPSNCPAAREHFITASNFLSKTGQLGRA